MARQPGGDADPWTPPRTRGLLERRQASLSPSYRLFFREPLHVVRGRGVWLYDADGNAFLDAYNNVVSVGHANPQVVAAIARQSAKLTTHTRYLTAELVDYAELLLGHFPAGLDSLTMTCTGTEANELAYRMACLATCGRGFIVTEHAYHGWTAALSAMSAVSGGPAAEWIRRVPAPDARRHPDVASRFADDVRQAATDLRRSGIRVAALLVDTSFSGDGIFLDPAGFLGPAVQAIHEAGGLFIADEVQAGFARVGGYMWGFGRHCVEPDIVTLGKPMGNGYPVGGLITRRDIAAEFSSHASYFNTFAGNPVACAAGTAVLDVIERQELRARAAEVGAYLAARVRDVARRHPAVGDVRAAGLCLGLEMAPRFGEQDAAGLTGAVINGMREHGVLVGSTGPTTNVVKIRPPLVFGREHVDILVTRLDEVLGVLAEGTAQR